MQTYFDRAINERRTAFELHFVLELQDRFTRQVRATREAAHWAAQTMGLSQEEEDLYVGDLLDALICNNGAEGVLEKITDDFAARGVSYAPHRLRRAIAGVFQA